MPGPGGTGWRWAGPPGAGMGPRMGPRRGRGRPRRGGEERVTAEQRQHVSAWFAGRVPPGWFAEAPQVTVAATLWKATILARISHIEQVHQAGLAACVGMEITKCTPCAESLGTICRLI